jgi:hypothetical protein
VKENGPFVLSTVLPNNNGGRSLNEDWVEKYCELTYVQNHQKPYDICKRFLGSGESMDTVQ